MKDRPLVVFAPVPPPDHGQSRMVALMLDVLRGNGQMKVFHVDARFSRSLEEIGAGSLLKFLLTLRYLLQAVSLRFRLSDPVLYFVPGPVKRSAVMRDWVLLFVLRLFYRKVVFHWHAIGQGEWAHGSDRVSWSGLGCCERIGRKLSAMVLEKPWLSIAVSANSLRDARSVHSDSICVVPNGIDDPCPEYGTLLRQTRATRWRVLESDPAEPVRLLFLSYGCEAKGLFDVMEALRLLHAKGMDRPIALTIAGGVSPTDAARYEREKERLEAEWKSRLTVHAPGFVDGDDKWRCYREHDLFLAASRWESFGLTVVEAMAHGLPVIAAASDGVSGILGSDYAFQVPVADPQALSSCIQGGIDALRKGELVDVSEDFRHRFEEEFTVTTFSNNILDALRFHQVPAREKTEKKFHIMAYLADQHPKLGRSLGIARMTEVVLRALSSHGEIQLGAVVSKSSIKAPEGTRPLITVPWATRGRVMRALTDNLHPLVSLPKSRPDVWYFPKGFMPRLSHAVQPSVATIHDTIIQYYQDHYPKWRLELEYSYWAAMLRNTLVHATEVMTVSHNAREQILDFIRRHGLPEREIHVTYESCLYENIPQPTAPAKADYVLHLASREPHKRTAWLVKLWEKWASAPDGIDLPKLHLVGKLPEDVVDLVARSTHMAHLPFLEDQALISQFIAARALLFPSEIEGFGLPAIEAYYLGTPVCFVQGTSVEEVLQPATSHGGFDLNDPETLRDALEKVLSLTPEEIHATGLTLREEYHSSKVINHMIQVFHSVGRPA